MGIRDPEESTVGVPFMSRGVGTILMARLHACFERLVEAFDVIIRREDEPFRADQHARLCVPKWERAVSYI